jgi:hypothetical protein
MLKEGARTTLPEPGVSRMQKKGRLRPSSV